MKNSDKALILNGFHLKVLAFLFMTIDHLGVFLQQKGMPAGDIMRYFGRLAFPLFVFLLAEGMRLSHHKGRYVRRLALMYLIITLPETILVYVPSLSELFDVSPMTLDPHPFADILFLGLLLYCMNSKGWRKALALLPATFFIATFWINTVDFDNPYFPYYLRSGYGLVALLLGLSFYFMNVILDMRANKGREISRLSRNLFNVLALGIALGVAYLLALSCPSYSDFGQNWMNWEIYAIFAGIFLIFYNGKRGYDAPWWRIFSYSYFLIHMAVLYLIFAWI